MHSQLQVVILKPPHSLLSQTNSSDPFFFFLLSETTQNLMIGNQEMKLLLTLGFHWLRVYSVEGREKFSNSTYNSYKQLLLLILPLGKN
jgi:hypothetical protein